VTPTFLQDVLDGLSSTPKTLPSKHLYDAEGSRLFELITALPEYYPTRTETALLERIAPEISARIVPGASLVEFGSGASVKTRLVLDASPQLARYVPIDISPSALAAAAADIGVRYPRLKVEPVVGDFTGRVVLPPDVLAADRMGFFPGSTIGNFAPAEAAAFLKQAREMLGGEAGLLVGIDLVKDPAVLVAAYDDAQGVTAAFNRNLLVRMVRDLGAHLDPFSFDHRAVWNAHLSRIEMHLVSRREQVVTVGDRSFPFEQGETIKTENSHKFTVEGFTALADRAGWQVAQAWTTEPPYALVLLL
jgi:dimethylhistidine N-methyltransferase